MSVLLLAALLALAAARPGPQKPSTHGAQVLRVTPNTVDQAYYLQGLLSLDLYDFWTEPRAPGVPVDIMASAWSVPVLKKTLNDNGMSFFTMIPDVALHSANAKEMNEAARAKFFATKSVKHDMDWTAYHTLEEIYGYMDYLAETYPEVVSVVNIGTSYEGREMHMVKLSTGGEGKPGIFIDGGIHAREWIAPATVAYALNQLVESGSFQDILDAVDFYILPSINPDGYVYSWDYERYWRKTRSDHGSSLGCLGADPNRNWSFHWDEIGASDNKCSDIYAGPYAFSEVEMANVRDQIAAQSNLIAYLTFHSYSQLWMYPWGFTTDLPDDWQDLDDLAQNAVNALTAVHGTHYDIGSSTNTIYAAAGGSDDWAKGEGGVKYAYTIELRDTGYWGFELPPEQIQPTAEETWEGIKVVCDFVKDTYGKK